MITPTKHHKITQHEDPESFERLKLPPLSFTRASIMRGREIILLSLYELIISF